VVSTASSSFDSFDDLFNILGLSVKFTEWIGEGHVSLGKMVNGLISVLIFEEDKAKCELALCSLDVLGSELNLIEV